MVFVESGSAVQKVNSETVELRRGDMFVIADDSEHSMRPTCEENDFKVVNISGARISSSSIIRRFRR